MTITFTISGNSSVLSCNFNPPIYLDDDKSYFLGLADFETFMSIPNIEEGKNDKLYIGDKIITIPEGTYDISDISKYLKIQIKNLFKDDETDFSLKPNVNTLKCFIYCNKRIDFTKKDSIGKLLGFKERIIEADVWEESDYVVNINKVNAICVDCNMCIGSFNNGRPVHIIHQFFPTVAPGYKIVESPLPILYFPVSGKTINNITVRVIDQDGNLINFRKETITVRLHLKSEPMQNGY